MGRRDIFPLLAATGVFFALASPDVLAAEAMPAGHPTVDDENPHARAAAGAAQVPGMFVPPEDEERPAPNLPPGSIVVEIRDPDGLPVPRQDVTLGILVSSVAKGENRQHMQSTTDEHGRVGFSGLETASNIAYRVSAGYEGGLYAAPPFQLQEAKSMQVVLHVYPVTRDLQQAKVVAEATLEAEVRDDRIQVEEVLTIYNLGRVAWQPEDVAMKLPVGFTGFGAQATMGDQGVDENASTAKLRGTFPPGRQAVDFRWQLPWAGDTDVNFEVGLPPHVAIGRVIMPVSGGISLTVVDFPSPEARHDAQGQKFLVTERHLRPEEPKLASLSIGLHGLPSQGPGRLLATLLATCGVAVGLGLTVGGRRTAPSTRRSGRSAVLDDLVSLERSRASGEVGPKTYERTRRELIDVLAGMLEK